MPCFGTFSRTKLHLLLHTTGFFREIGRADRLGSGIRNLYKYSKYYGGEDPIFVEGDRFLISIPLVNLKSIRMSLEKPHIDDEEPHIDEVKTHIGIFLEDLNLSTPTKEHIIKLYKKFGRFEVFGRKEVCLVTSLQNRAASALIHQMLLHRILDTVAGQGKGKYRFSKNIF